MLAWPHWRELSLDHDCLMKQGSLSKRQIAHLAGAQLVVTLSDVSETLLVEIVFAQGSPKIQLQESKQNTKEILKKVLQSGGHRLQCLQSGLSSSHPIVHMC